MLFWCRDGIIAQLDDWKLLPKTETLTELYFTQNVQHTARANGTHTLVFVVHNLEHRSVSYHFKIVATTQNNTEYELKSGNLALAHSNTQTLTEQVTLPNTQGRIQVRVELEYNRDAQSATQTQSIHYWVTIAHIKEASYAA